MKLSKIKMAATASYSVTIVLLKETAFPLWRAMDKRWKRNVVSLVSSVMTVMRLPISCVSSTAMWCHVPAVSTANYCDYYMFVLALCLGLPWLLHFAWVVDDAKCIVVTRVCVSVCLSAVVRPHYYTDPDVTWRRGRGCSPVVHYWADLQSGHGLRCYGNITRTVVTSLRPSRDMTT